MTTNKELAVVLAADGEIQRRLLDSEEVWEPQSINPMYFNLMNYEYRTKPPVTYFRVVQDKETLVYTILTGIVPFSTFTTNQYTKWVHEFELDGH